jgi:sugar lactone lactonase YvrE
MKVGPPVRVACVLLALTACGGGSPSKNPTPPADTGGDGGGEPTGGTGGKAAPPKVDASMSPDVSSPEPDTGASATGGTTGGAEAGVAPDLAASQPDMGTPPAGEFPLAAVKAGKAALFGRVNTQTEGPSFRDGSVYFASDGNGLVRMDETGKLFKYHPKLQPVGTYLLADGSLLVCDKTYTVVQVFKDGGVASLFSAADHAKADFCNDLTIDAKGDIYFSNPHNDTVWRMSVAGALDRVAALAKGAFPNGLEVDRAGTSLYVSASDALWKIALPDSGTTFPAPQKLSAPGGADGMAFDAWDHLWLSIYTSGQLVVWDPATKQTVASISAGAASSTNVCFGTDAVYTTVFEKGVYKIPVPGIRGFLHPGAAMYTIKQMLDLKPVNDPL